MTEAAIEARVVECTAESGEPMLGSMAEEDWHSPKGQHCNNQAYWDRYGAQMAGNIPRLPDLAKNAPNAYSSDIGVGWDLPEKG